MHLSLAIVLLLVIAVSLTADYAEAKSTSSKRKKTGSSAVAQRNDDDDDVRRDDRRERIKEEEEERKEERKDDRHEEQEERRFDRMRENKEKQREDDDDDDDDSSEEDNKDDADNNNSGLRNVTAALAKNPTIRTSNNLRSDANSIYSNLHRLTMHILRCSSTDCDLVNLRDLFDCACSTINAYRQKKYLNVPQKSFRTDLKYSVADNKEQLWPKFEV